MAAKMANEDKEEQIRQAFIAFDRDGNGYISRSEMKKVSVEVSVDWATFCLSLWKALVRNCRPKSSMTWWRKDRVIMSVIDSFISGSDTHNKADIDGDNQVSFEEFMVMMNGS